MKSDRLSRRTFLKVAAAGAALATGTGPARSSAAPSDRSPEADVVRLYESLSPQQRTAICFDWDYVDPKRGLLRTRVANNWRVTEPAIQSEFYKREQQQIIRRIFEGLIQPDWHARFDRQLTDDVGGFGQKQTIAIFGRPGQGKFQFLLTSRHMTLRCDGGSNQRLAFGGPIFYGHAAGSYNEKPDHPGNVFWHQAQAANELFRKLNDRQQAQALLKQAPPEGAVGFRGPRGDFPGIAIAALSAEQKQQAAGLLDRLVAPYRQADRDRVCKCVESQGGLEKCHLAFYESDDLGADRVWDIWRLEGPAFVWHFRGAPHVHVWANVADDPSVRLNA